MMAYPRPIYDPRSPHESERTRSAWDPVQRPHYPSMPSPIHHTMPSPGLLDPESESSDVSDTGEDHQSRIHSAYPAQLPPPPPKHALESLESIEARLRDLQRIEDHNIKKQEQLKFKRARKDERIRRKREAQDLKIKAIMDARERRNHRIDRRRKMEDEAFERFDQDLEDEETNLRRRQKRLKRGLPIEEGVLGSRISSASMSPPGPVYSSVPPPAKRHQTGPPGQNNSPVISASRPAPHSAPSAPTSTGPNPPPYAFLQSIPPPTSAPYGRSPTISHSPQNNAGGFQPIPRSHQPPSEPSPYALNGHPPSPHASRPPAPPINPVLNTAPPPRQTSSYDTRPPPPPPVSSGFATINTPATSGFAPINPRSTATPPAPAATPLVKGPDHDRVNGHTRPYATEGTPTASPAVTGSKRTPSSTHPYQQSEAFANRHHHCERVDHLNRGIWTSYGSGGTKEAPTGPPVEMYLRCNHDGCRRIDWRTVHGLQCHIVKNHEQPKGTIGSLEKALDRYGVPVAEVEAYERQHGDGTGGTMADPKNIKLKQKPGQSIDRPDGRRSYGAQQNPVAYQTNIVRSLGNATQPYQGSPASVRSLQHEDTEDSETETRGNPTSHINKASQPPSRFAAVNVAWSTTPAPHPGDSKDHEMKNNPGSTHILGAGGPPKHDSTFWKGWPEAPGSIKPETTSHALPPVAQGVPPVASLPGQNQHSSGIGGSSPSHNRSGSAQHTPIQPSHPPNMVPTQQHTSPKLEQSPVDDHNKGIHNKDIQAPIPPVVQPVAQEQVGADNNVPVENAEMTGTSAQDVPPLQPSAPVQEKRAFEAQESKRESEKFEKPKAEVVEPTRPEPKSPEIARRPSIVSVRKAGSRRPSMATRAEREREKEREEAAAAAAAKAEAEAEAERERERQENEEDRKKVDTEIETETDKGGEQEKDDDSEDPDTITAVVSSASSKDKEKDREKEGKENKTTPRRQRNGRFVRNNR